MVINQNFKSRIIILHVISGDIWAGAENQVYQTISNYSGSESIAVVLFNKEILYKKLLKLNINVFAFEEQKQNTLKILTCLYKLFRQINPTIIHAHGYKEHVLSAISLYLCHSKATIVRTFHGMHKIPFSIKPLKKIKSYLVFSMEKFLLNRCILIAVSKDLEFQLRRQYKNAVVYQVYNSILLPLEVSTQNRKMIRKTFNIPDNAFWVITLARLENVKNLPMLIKAAKILATDHNEIRFSVFGIGPLKNYLDNYIQQLNLQNIFKLEGFHLNTYSILSAIDAFVLCSHHEGMPMSLIEAMASKKAVICTAVGGIPEIIKNEISGILIDKNDEHQLAKSIADLIANPEYRRFLGINGYHTINNSFSISTNNLKLSQIYKRCIHISSNFV